MIPSPVVWDKAKGRPKWLGWSVVIDNMLIQEGMLIPRWYGVAWREYDRDCSVVMPIPLNLIAGQVRRSLHWLRFGWVKDSVLDRVKTESYHRGHVAGHNARVNQERGAAKMSRSREEWVRQNAHETGFREAMKQTEALILRNLDDA